MAAPVLQAVGAGSATISDITVAWPTHAVDDVALLIVESCGGQAAVLGTANGFVEVTGSPQATGTGTAGTQLTVFWCRATSTSMASPVVTDSGDHTIGLIVTYRGCVASGDPWDVTAGGVKATASTTTTFPSVTTTVDDCLIVLLAARDTDTAVESWSALTNGGLTSLVEDFDGGGNLGNGGGIHVGSGVKATAGSTGTSTATVLDSINAMLTIALKPPVSASDFVGTATLSGSGSLGSSGAPAPTQTGALSGSGSLSTTQTAAIPGVAALSGGGTLSTAQTPRPTQVASLSGAGTLGTTQSPGPTRTVALSGSGTLSLVSTINLFNPSRISTSFEDSTTLGWAGRTNVASLTSVASNASHGSRSMRVTANASGGSVQFITSGFHPVTVGQYYAFSFYAESTLAFQMWIDWYDSSGNYVTYSGVYLGAPPGNAGRLKCEAVLPPTGVGVTQFKTYIEALSVPANGSYYVDAIQYEQAYYATSYADPLSGRPALAQTVALSGTGTLSGLSTPRPLGTASLSGSGTLDATGVVAGDNWAASPTLSGSGSLTTTSIISGSGIAGLSGSGTLGAAATPRPTQIAALSGTGTLTTTQTLRPSQIASLSGSGTLTSTQTPRPTSSVALSGSGTLATTQTPRPAPSVTLSGSGTLLASGNAGADSNFTGTAILSGSGSLTTTRTLTTSGTATLGGVGTLTTAFNRNLFNQTLVSTSFEGGTTIGWAGRTNVNNLTSDAINSSHGTKSMRVAATSAGGVVGVITSGFHPCTAGLPYSFGFHATTTLAFQLWVDWYNAAGTYLSTSGVYLGAPAGGAGRLSWNNVTAPVGATKLKVFFEALSVPANGVYYVDAFQYEQATAATSYTESIGTPGLTQTVVLSGAGTLSTVTTPRPARNIALSGTGTLTSLSLLADVTSDADWILTCQLLDGGIAQYPDKLYMVPYFSHFAAIGLARATEVTGNPVYTAAAWDWLDWYAAHMDANGFVTDYSVAPTTQALTSTGDYDSTDSYAGMFLLAAHKTWRVTDDLTRLATLNTGLNNAMTAIEATQEPDGLTWAKPSYKVKYLMDQAEVYAGLQAAYDMAIALGNTTLQSRALTASNALVAGVETMWNPTNQSYSWAVHENGVHEVTDWSIDYPHASAQMWAVAFGLVRGMRATALCNKYEIEQSGWNGPVAGWAFMQVGQFARAQNAASTRRAESISANRAYPWISASSGQLIVLESTDTTYLAPFIGTGATNLSGSGTLSTTRILSVLVAATLTGSGTLSTPGSNVGMVIRFGATTYIMRVGSSRVYLRVGP